MDDDAFEKGKTYKAYGIPPPAPEEAMGSDTSSSYTAINDSTSCRSSPSTVISSGSSSTCDDTWVEQKYVILFFNHLNEYGKVEKHCLVKHLIISF